MIPIADPRRVRLASLYGQGLANREIAAELGISKERVRQLLLRYEIPIVPVRERRYLAAVEGREAEVVAEFLRLRSDAAVARRLGLQEQHVRRLIDARVPEADVLRRKKRSHRPLYTDQELITALQEAALDLPSPMGYQAFKDWVAGRQRSGLPWPGPQVVLLRFGGWRRALVRAGLPVNRGGGPHATYDLQDVVAAIAAAWRELGRCPSVTGYEAWRARRPGLPAPATARHFGESWDDLVAAAYPLVYGPSAGDGGDRDPAQPGR
jgi:DNA-binding CsgD family transcriptional regulator